MRDEPQFLRFRHARARGYRVCAPRRRELVAARHADDAMRGRMLAVLTASPHFFYGGRISPSRHDDRRHSKSDIMTRRRAFHGMGGYFGPRKR